MTISILAFLFIAASASHAPAFSPLTVQTTAGVLEGITVTKVPYGTVRQFLGVPYATSTRFQAPVTLNSDASTIVRKVHRHGQSCVQPPHLKEVISPLLDTEDQPNMSEDCLNLSLYVPEVTKRGRMPVMIWFPGEGFDYSDASQFDASYLSLLGNVIVVTVNYRVGVFGFLSALSKDAPGNLAFRDQQMAIQWVKQNIKAFGGDPENLTLFGRFTGAMSLSIQLTIPSNRVIGKPKLFQRVILQSGIATGPWVFDDKPLEAVRALAKQTNHCQNDKTIPEIVACLRRIPTTELLHASLRVPQRWRPVIDGKYIVEDPIEALQKGHHMDIDTMLGTNSDEGSLCLITQYALNTTFYPKILNDNLSQSDFGELVNTALVDFLKQSNPSLKNLVAHEYSFREEDQASSRFREKYLRFCGAMYISSHAEEVARALAQKQKRTFVYRFDHRPSFSTHSAFVKAAHGDDVLFSLGLVHRVTDAPKEEIELSRKMVQAFSNFARNGKPSFGDSRRIHEWPEYSQNGRQVLHFTVNNITPRRTEADKDADFWHVVVPSFLKSSPAFGPVSDEEDTINSSSKEILISDTTAGYIIGSLLSVQATEYAILTLMCLTLFMVVLTTTYFFRRPRKTHNFLSETF